MRIFALETDIEKLNTGLLIPGERLMLAVRFHGFHFILVVLRSMLTLVILLIAVSFAWMLNIPAAFITLFAFACVLIFVLPSVLRGFIDWWYDEIVITSEKIVVVNQKSLLWQEIKQMNLENIASVKAETQYWGLMPFGRLCFELKEGTGKPFCVGYIPEAQRVASVVSEALVQFQRRQGSTPPHHQ